MRRPVIVTRADGKEALYPSIQAVMMDLNLFPPSVHRALNHRKRLNKGPYKGWKFRYEDTPVEEIEKIEEAAQPVAVPSEFSSYPRSRHEAIEQGVTHYYTGKPCKHGHVTLRKTQGVCIGCAKAAWEAAKVTRKEYFEEYRKRPYVIAKSKENYAGIKAAKSLEPVPPMPNPTYKELMEQARVKPRT